MADVAAPTFTPRRHGRAVLALLLVLFLGLLSFAAVGQMTVKCGPEYLTGNGKILTGNGQPLTTGRQQCQVVAGEFRVPLPAWLPFL